MYVRVISFGTNWWMMHPSDTDDPYCFRRRAAYFNAAALKSGRRLHHSAIYPGQIRFNTQSGFDPEFPSRAIGKTFLCSGPNQFAGKIHLLFQRLVTDVCIRTAYLVALNSVEHGMIRFRRPGWMSSGVTADLDQHERSKVRSDAADSEQRLGRKRSWALARRRKR